jgi:tripartite-type tricarboxylate transporter receptor subunit TctC
MQHRSIMTRRAIVCIAAVLTLGMTVSAAYPQTYPSKPIKVIVPLSPASTVDIVAHHIGEQLAAELGQPLIIENKPGAGGTIGTEALVRAPKDGYTIGMTSSNHVINPSVIKSIPFDSIKDITPISIIGTSALVLVAHPSVPARTTQELIAPAKAKPALPTAPPETAPCCTWQACFSLEKPELTSGTFPIEGRGPWRTTSLPAS